MRAFKHVQYLFIFPAQTNFTERTSSDGNDKRLPLLSASKILNASVPKCEQQPSATRNRWRILQQLAGGGVSTASNKDTHCITSCCFVLMEGRSQQTHILSSRLLVPIIGNARWLQYAILPYIPTYDLSKGFYNKSV